MARKDWFYSEQISLLSTTNTISVAACATGDVALTATHDLDAGNYLVIWSFNLGMSVEVVETTAGASCCVDGTQKQRYRVVSQDSGTRHTCMAFAYVTGMTAGTHTFSVRYGVVSGAGVLRRANIRQVHQLVVKMNSVPDAENYYTEDLAQIEIFDTTYVNDVSLTFTPARANDTWILLANMSAGGSSTDLDDVFIKTVLDGTDITNREAHIFCHSVSPSERYPYWAVAVRTLTAASHTFKMQVKAGPISSAANITHRRLMAFNLSRWPVVATQESDGEETFNGILFQTKTNPLSYTPVRAADHAWICGWLTNFTDPTLAASNESHVGTPTDLETQLHDDRAAAGSSTEYFTSGLLYHLAASAITPGTSPGAMEDRVKALAIAFDIKTKGYSGFVLRRAGETRDPMRSGGMVVPFQR